MLGVGLPYADCLVIRASDHKGPVVTKRGDELAAPVCREALVRAHQPQVAKVVEAELGVRAREEELRGLLPEREPENADLRHEACDREPPHQPEGLVVAGALGEPRPVEEAGPLERPGHNLGLVGRHGHARHKLPCAGGAHEVHASALVLPHPPEPHIGVHRACDKKLAVGGVCAH